ncbi:MAG: cupin, partial [Thermoleophilaceae bacterium]
MPELIETPTRVEAAGTPPKVIEEFVGRVNSGEERASVARMRSPEGWSEPGQRPDFDEYTVVLDGCLHVQHEDGELRVRA